MDYNWGLTRLIQGFAHSVGFDDQNFDYCPKNRLGRLVMHKLSIWETTILFFHRQERLDYHRLDFRKLGFDKQDLMHTHLEKRTLVNQTCSFQERKQPHMQTLLLFLMRHHTLMFDLTDGREFHLRKE